MRFPRFRIRALMIAVALIAVGLELSERSTTFRRRATHHRNESFRAAFGPGTHSRSLKVRRLMRAKDRWHSDLIEKYELAARYPWLPVAPDPPEPK